MAPIISTVEIARPSAEVFDYVIDPSRFHEWQSSIVAGRMDGARIEVGARCITTRRIGGAAREVVSRITEYDRPRHWADHGVDGPIRGKVQVEVDSLENDTRSRVTITLDFEGHGIGRLLIPLLVRRQAVKEMVGNMASLKRRLEAG